MTFTRSLAFSRPRFWIYLVGPFVVALAAAGEMPTVPIILLGLYLLLPANLLIYGVNDIFDQETDQLNSKKGSYENRLRAAEVHRLTRAIIVLNVPFLAVLFWILPGAASLWLVLFLVTGIGYSAPPIRAKARPLLDAAFNILYATPAFAAYVAVSGNQPAPAIVLASLLWCMAMHAYSAVPDIAADKKSGTPTIATMLGGRTTLVTCAVLYAGAAVLSYPYVGLFAVFAGLVYITLMAVSLAVVDSSRLFGWYKLFPIVNTLLGGMLFFVAFYAN